MRQYIKKNLITVTISLMHNCEQNDRSIRHNLFLTNPLYLGVLTDGLIIFPRASYTDYMFLLIFSPTVTSFWHAKVLEILNNFLCYLWKCPPNQHFSSFLLQRRHIIEYKSKVLLPPSWRVTTKLCSTYNLKLLNFGGNFWPHIIDVCMHSKEKNKRKKKEKSINWAFFWGVI